MKNIKKIGFLLLAVLLIIPFAEVDAQKRRKPKKESQKVVNSFIDVYGGGGYSALFNNVGDATVPGGGAGMLGVGYFMKHKSGFNFRGGVEFMFLNSTTNLGDRQFDAKFVYNDSKLSDYEMKYLLDFADYKEQHNRISLNIPVMFGAQFDQIYFLAGAKAGINMMSNYAMKSMVTASLSDDMLIENMGNMPTHDLETFEVAYGNKLNLNLDVMLSAEVGMCLDKYFPASALEYGEGVNKRAISYRVGAFVDYGLLDINKSEKKDFLLNFPGMKDDYSGPAANVKQLQNHSVLAVKDANGGLPTLNSFVVGAKFTVLLGMDKAPKIEKKKKPRRPTIREISYIPDPTFFYLFVNDFETGEPLDAMVSVYNFGEKLDTIFAGMTDKETGFVEKQIDNGQYGITIKRPGYIDYNDTLFNVVSDTLYVDLQPIKKNTVVILRNLLFDTDKTTIRNISAPSLEELYELLVKNPNIRIRITGHTDNVGSERYNKKLSEGRAKAVYDEMVKRGIAPERMEWNGKGSKEPIESNKTPEGRAENRRVEFTILSE